MLLWPLSTEIAIASEFVWQYFTIVENDVTRAMCTKCHVKISRGPNKAKMSIFPLKRHLQSCQKLEYDKLDDYVKEKLNSKEKSGEKSSEKRPNDSPFNMRNKKQKVDYVKIPFLDGSKIKPNGQLILKSIKK